MSDRYVETYSPNNPIMTGKVLLELVQNYKYASLKRAFENPNILSSRDLKVTQEDIENMGDTLKMTVFCVTTNCYREAIELAKERGVLVEYPNWLR